MTVVSARQSRQGATDAHTHPTGFGEFRPYRRRTQLCRRICRVDAICRFATNPDFDAAKTTLHQDLAAPIDQDHKRDLLFDRLPEPPAEAAARDSVLASEKEDTPSYADRINQAVGKLSETNMPAPNHPTDTQTTDNHAHHIEQHHGPRL